MNQFYNAMPETPQQAARRQQLAAMLQQQMILPEQNMKMPGTPQMPDYSNMAKNKRDDSSFGSFFSQLAAPVAPDIYSRQYSPSMPNQ
jgi:hypothetical protein